MNVVCRRPGEHCVNFYFNVCHRISDDAVVASIGTDRGADVGACHV